MPKPMRDKNERKYREGEGNTHVTTAWHVQKVAEGKIL